MDVRQKFHFLKFSILREMNISLFNLTCIIMSSTKCYMNRKIITSGYISDILGRFLFFKYFSCEIPENVSDQDFWG